MRKIVCLLALSLWAIGASALIAEPVSILSGSRLLAESDLVVAVQVSAIRYRVAQPSDYLSLQPRSLRIFKGHLNQADLSILSPEQGLYPDHVELPIPDSSWILLYLKKADQHDAWQYTSRHPLQQDIPLPANLEVQDCSDLAAVLALSAEQSDAAHQPSFIWLLGGLSSPTATTYLQKLSDSADPAIASLALCSRLLAHDSSAIPAAHSFLASEKLSPSDRTLLANTIPLAE